MPKFSDLNIKFAPNPLTGDLVIVNDLNSVKQSIKNILYSSAYDRPFRSQENFVDSIQNILFQQLTPVTTTLLKADIERKILQHEPRVLVLSVDVKQEKLYTVSINIQFKIRTTSEIATVTVQLERV